MQLMQNLFQKMAHWNRSGTNMRGRIFWKRFTVFDQDLSPDAIAWSKMNNLKTVIDKLQRDMTSACKLNHTKTVKRDDGHKLEEDEKNRDDCVLCGRNKTKELRANVLLRAENADTNEGVDNVDELYVGASPLVTPSTLRRASRGK
jgi:hypothetical protein